MGTTFLRAGLRHFKFIAYSLHGSNEVYTYLLPDLANVNVDGAIANYHVSAPNPLKYFIPQEHTTRL